MKLEIEYIPINEIKLYPNNAKIHTAEQIEQIKKSIQEFGFNDPIGIWHGECVEGHGRIIAATELGIETVPVIRLDELTDEQRRAYMLVHNKLTMNTNFDFGMLELELDDITNIDMQEFGFEESDFVDVDKYIDDFFDRGVETSETKIKYGVRVEVGSQEEQQTLEKYLEEKGYKPLPL